MTRAGDHASRASTIAAQAVPGRKRHPELFEQAPSIIQRGGKCCGPQYEQKVQGGLGSQITFKRKSRDNMFTVYAHIDILAGRNLMGKEQGVFC